MKTKLLCFLFATAALFMGIRSSALAPDSWILPLPQGTGEPVSVLVKQGMNARQVAEEFAEAGIIDQGRGALLARWMVRFVIDRRLRPGLYTVRRGTPWEVARQMRTAEPSFSALTLVPGTDIYSFAALFPDTVFSEKTLEDLLMDDSLYPGDLVPLLPENVEGRLAFLLPETYHLALKNERSLVASAAALWWRRIGAAINNESRNPQSFNELAIIASLVEREGFWDDERPRIAGVIKNRRKKGMPLQIDATVVYAWKREGREITRVLFKDLEIDSPYNTYKIPDLPPAPICTPSETSWLATLKPEKHDYLYYVAQSDGRHVFAATYAEHQRNIRRVRGK